MDDVYSTPQKSKGAGWVIFAGILLGIAGTLNAIYGIAAISGSRGLPDNANYITGSLKTWGWIALIVGIVQFGSMFAIWSGERWGRWVGITSASLNAIVQLMWIPAQPFATLAIFSLDIIVLYGLLAYGKTGLASPGKTY